MKKNLLILLTLGIFTNGFSQKFKFKFDDDVIYNDKTPIAKVEGETKKLNAIVDLTFKSLAGKLLFTVKTQRKEFIIPDDAKLGYYDRTWTEINFPDLNKTINIDNEIFRTKKGVSKFLFDEIEKPILKDSSLDIEAINSFSSKKDVSESINKMISDYKKFEEITIKNLEEPISRDFSKPITLSVINESSNILGTATVYSITQDSREVGYLHKNIRVYSGSTITTTSYIIYKTLNSPMMVNNKNLDKGFSAIMGDAAFPTVFTLKDKKSYKFKLEPGQNISTQMLADYLVKTGYL